LGQAIIETIPDHLAFGEHEEELFDSYCDWLALMKRTHERLSVITSNYDMVADVAACHVDLPAFFGPSVTWGWPSSGAVVTTSV
jgi:hypothetical protein